MGILCLPSLSKRFAFYLQTCSSVGRVQAGFACSRDNVRRVVSQKESSVDVSAGGCSAQVYGLATAGVLFYVWDSGQHDIQWSVSLLF